MGDGSGPVCDDKIGAGKVPELLLVPPNNKDKKMLARVLQRRKTPDSKIHTCDHGEAGGVNLWTLFWRVQRTW